MASTTKILERPREALKKIISLSWPKPNFGFRHQPRILEVSRVGTLIEGGNRSWKKFWNDRQARSFQFLTDEQKAKVEERLAARLEELQLTGDEQEEWIEKHLLKGRELPREGDVHLESDPIAPGPRVS